MLLISIFLPFEREGHQQSMLTHNSLSQKLAIFLAILAGLIDALGYLSLDGMFVSFMSGNSIRFAVGINDSSALGVTLIPKSVRLNTAKVNPNLEPSPFNRKTGPNTDHRPTSSHRTVLHA